MTSEHAAPQYTERAPMATTLSPAATEALRSIRAIRKLPQSSATLNAEKRATKNLTVDDVIAVALTLQADEVGVR